MTFWLIVLAVNVAAHAVALVLLRRPLAVDLAQTPGGLDDFPEAQQAIITAIDRDAAAYGFRWFGVTKVQAMLGRPHQPAALWWNGDLGAYLTFESAGSRWNLELCADLEDGSMLSVAKMGFPHLAPPPAALLISRSRIRSFRDLVAALPMPLEHLPVRRGWPAPGQEWTRAIERRELLFRHWTATGRAAPTADGRGIRFRFLAANIFVVLGGYGVKQAIAAAANRRAAERLTELATRLRAWSAPPVSLPPSG